jgi:hypothetical protein
LRDFIATKARFAILARAYPARAERLLALAQRAIDDRWRLYEQLRRWSERSRDALELNLYCVAADPRVVPPRPRTST